MTLANGTLSIELVMNGRKALVVGGCRECALKIPRLLAAGAEVRVVVDGDVETAIVEHFDRGEITLERRAFHTDDLNEVAITFVSPDLEELGVTLFEAARARGTLVSTLDRPAASTFVNPAVVERRGIKMAFSSGGVAPALLRRIREDLEQAFDDPRLGELVDSLREARAMLPRGERADTLRGLVEGFSVQTTFVFPNWLRSKNDETPPK